MICLLHTHTHTQTQIPGAKATFIDGIVTEIGKTTNAHLTTNEHRHALSAIQACARRNSDGFFVEELYKAAADFIEDPARATDPTQRVMYMYAFRDVLLSKFSSLKRVPNVCAMPGAGETVWL